MPREGTALPRPSGASEWLALAAAPVFLTMAGLAGLPAEGPLRTLCSGEVGTGLAGMVPMYLLMSLFHAEPWLRVSGLLRRGDGLMPSSAGATPSPPP